MKKGWTYKKLGEVTTFQNGFAFKSSLFRKDGLPIVRISSIQNEEIKEDDLVSFYPSDYDVNFDNYKIFPNDILIAMSGGTTGKLGINKSDKIFYQNQRVGVIRENNKYLNHRFLFYFLHTKSEESLKIAAGAAQPNLSTAQIKDFIIPLPTISEQARIVERLDAAFAQIDELKANAEKQLAEARALFQKSLSKAMEPKEGWEEKTLGDVAEIFSGYAFKSSVFKKEGKYQVLRIGNIKQNNLRLSDNAIFIDDLERGVLNKSLLKKGDLVVTQTGTRHKRDYGFVAMVDKENLLLNQRNACIRFDNVLSAQFFLYYSYTELYKDTFFANEGGTVGQGNVGLSALKEMIYFTPPLSEQQRIVERLDSISENVRKYEEIQRKIIAECDALKQALLRQVFE